MSSPNREDALHEAIDLYTEELNESLHQGIISEEQGELFGEWLSNN